MEPKKAYLDPMSDPTAMSMLERIRAGMKVVDGSGEDAGTVEFVKMGDPEAVTTEGQDLEPTGAVFAAPSPSSADGSGRPIMAIPVGPSPGELGADLPEPVRSRLLREGYVKIGKGLIFQKDRYVFPEQIASVSGEVVKLTVSQDDLAS